MIDAALYLLRCTLRNRGRLLLRQLRSPRYVLAVAVGLAYLLLLGLGQRLDDRPVLEPGLVELVGSLLLLGLAAKWWLIGADASALAFSRPEVQFLFPAPISRTALICYKLGRAQLLVVLNVVLWTILFRSHGRAIGIFLHGVGLWVLFSTILLHRLGVSLTRDSLLQHGRSGWRRAWLAVVTVALFTAGVGASLARVSADGLGAYSYLAALTGTAPLRWLLLPFTVPLAPLEAGGVEQFLAALPAALLLLALHLLWVFRAKGRFEEAALEASARRAARQARSTTAGSMDTLSPALTQRSLPLADRGPAINAIVWKNLTRLLRSLSPSLLLAVAVLAAGGLILGISRPGGSEAVATIAGTVALSWAGVLALFGPQWIRADLRADLNQLDQIRAWPLRGWQVMTGMVLSSALALWILEVSLGAAGMLSLWSQGQLGRSAGLVLALSAVGAVALGGVSVVALGIQNGAALLYPTWVRTEIRPGGIEQMGQHLLTAGVSFLLLALFLLGPALVGGGTGYLLKPHLGAWALVPAGLAASAGLLLEAFLLLDWLGDRFEAREETT